MAICWVTWFSLMVPWNDDVAFRQIYLNFRYSILVDFWLTDVLCIENIQYKLIYSMYFLLYKSGMKSTQRKRLPLHPEQKYEFIILSFGRVGTSLGKFPSCYPNRKNSDNWGFKEAKTKSGREYLANKWYSLAYRYVVF